MMICYMYCKKCGRIAGGDEELEERCDVCGSIMIPVPEKYIRRDEILTDQRVRERAVALYEELVKPSPEFDQYLFDHRDEIVREQHAQWDAIEAHGRAILEGRASANGYSGRGGGRSWGPACPSCGSSNISKIGIVGRAVSVGLFGLASSKIGKTHKCNNCGTTW